MSDEEKRRWIARRLRRDGYEARADHRKQCVIVKHISEEERRTLAAQYGFARIYHPH